MHGRVPDIMPLTGCYGSQALCGEEKERTQKEERCPCVGGSFSRTLAMALEERTEAHLAKVFGGTHALAERLGSSIAAGITGDVLDLSDGKIQGHRATASMRAVAQLLRVLSSVNLSGNRVTDEEARVLAESEKHERAVEGGVPGFF